MLCQACLLDAIYFFMRSFALALTHDFVWGLCGRNPTKLVCFRRSSAASFHLLQSESDLSAPEDSSDEKLWSSAQPPLPCSCNRGVKCLSVQRTPLDVGNNIRNSSHMERNLLILKDRGWNMSFSDCSNSASVLGNNDVTRFLNELFHMSSDASFVFHFFQMCERHFGPNFGIYPVCTMIHILVMGNMNYRAMDLLLSVVRYGDGGEVRYRLILNTLQKTCKNQQILETVYSMLLRCCVQKHLIGFALKIIHHMKLLNFFPSSGVCIELLQVLLKSKQMELASEFVIEMLSHGIKLNSAVITLFIHQYCAEGSFSCAVQLFYDMNKYGCKPDTVVYTILMDALGKRGYLKEATCLFYKMIESGLSPDLVSITSLTDGYCKLGKWTEATNLLRLSSCSPNVYVYNCFISKLCSEGNVVEAAKLFCEMSDMGLYPDGCCFTTMIRGYCKINDLNRALKMFGEMLKRGVKPAVVTYTVLIDFYSKSGDMEGAEYLFNMMKREGIEPDVVTYNALIYGQSKHGLMHKAYEWMDRMKHSGCSPNVTTYNILIYGLIRWGYVKDAKVFWDELLSRGYSPDVFTFTSTIVLNSKQGNFHEAYLIWCYMSENGVKPDIITCGALLNGYCKAQQMEEAEVLFYNMLDAGLKPDLVLFNTLINGFCLNGNVRAAFKFVNMMVELGIVPNNVTFGVLTRGLSKSGVGNSAEIAAIKIRKILMESGIRIDDSQYAAIFGVF